MFRLDRGCNSIQPIQKVQFSSLNFHERNHLQEWIAKYPQALTQDSDDEILIIQKEFDGFDDTNERLDLLGIDKEGNLVIIENKRDDSGRDVVWQALKYAGYCSSLNKEQILDIFQRYLNKTSPENQLNAAEVLAEFLDTESLDEMSLNKAQTQRVILVAANFRKEVTNTALWLMEFGLRVQCIRVVPYQLGDEVLLDIHQIIPPPEAAEYMIGMSRKEKEECELKETHSIRKQFWTQLLAKLRASGCNLYNNISPSTDHWLYAGCGISGLHYSLVFGRKIVKVEFGFSRFDAALNTYAYKWLYAKRETVEAAFGHELEWLPLEGKKSCRVQYAKDITQGFSPENWESMQDWLVEHLTALERAIVPQINELGSVIRNYAQLSGTTEE